MWLGVNVCFFSVKKTLKVAFNDFDFPFTNREIVLEIVAKQFPPIATV
jgi:hypothetical protein